MLEKSINATLEVLDFATEIMLGTLHESEVTAETASLTVQVLKAVQHLILGSLLM